MIHSNSNKLFLVRFVYFGGLKTFPFSTLGKPPSYRPLRPRSTSEAVSGISNDEHNVRRKDDNRTLSGTESNNDLDEVCISPLQSEDDLDLLQPAPGISTLDFDPMSFQCSLASATPALQRSKDGSKWKRSVGCSSESEPISPPNNNIMCLLYSPDASPALRKSGKKVTSKQLSPKLRKKSFKTQADVQTASASLPPVSSSPPQVCEAPVAEGNEPRATAFQRCSPLSTTSQAPAVTDRTQSAQNLPDPGQCHFSITSHSIYCALKS